MKKIILISITLISILSKLSGQTQQVNCNNLYLDTDTFYIAYQHDTIANGNLFYFDSSVVVYPTLELILSDTSVITSPQSMTLSSIGFGYIQSFNFEMNFKIISFPNNTIVNGQVHISNLSSIPILDCYFPITIILQNTIGISEMKENEKIKIYPNPFVTELNIENNSTQLFLFTLYNSLGEKIIDKILANKTSRIDLSSYSGGIYFYKIMDTNSKITSGKIIKQ